MDFKFLVLALGILLHSAVVLLYKAGMNQIGRVDSFNQLLSLPVIWKIVTNPFLELGVFLSVAGLFLGFAVISNFKVSYVYPVSSLTYVIVVGLSVLLFRESLDWRSYVGIVSVITGVVLLNL